MHRLNRISLDFRDVQLALSLVLVAFVLQCDFAIAQSDLRMTPIVKAIQKSKPCVVNIEGKKMVRNESADNPQNKFKQVKGMGTGVIIDQRGYILTNYHVVDGVAKIQVRLADQTQTIARLIAHDARTDLAIIKIDLERPLKIINLGTSSDIMEGETVIAMGNAYGYRHSITKGIVSALGRNVPISEAQVYYDLIQTDAPINPGNSGGPLLNVNGQCIGINAAVRVGAQGIAFAIPINSALEVAADLLQRSPSTRLSVGFNTATDYVDHKPRLVVKSVFPNSTSGLQKGDVIETVRGEKVSRRIEFERQLLDTRSGQDIELGVRRADEDLVATVTLKPFAGTREPLVDESFQSLSWEMLGMELAPISDADFRRVSTKQNGGMRVTRVRPNGPAATQSIRPGDVLIGIHEWETTSENDVEYILKQEEIRSLNTVKYFILRGQSTLWGTIRVAARIK